MNLTAAQIEALLATLVPLPVGSGAPVLDEHIDADFDDEADLLDAMIAEARSADALICG